MGNGTNRGTELPAGSPQAGEVRRGTVTEITNFGVFVDLAGHEGLVDVLEVSWRRSGHPSQVVRVGEEVTVLVLSADPARGTAALSMRALTPDPLLDFARSKLGEVVPARIAAVNPVGVFAEVGDGLEGLIVAHEPPAGDAPVPSRPPSPPEPGDEVSVRVLSVNVHTRRIALSGVGSG